MCPEVTGILTTRSGSFEEVLDGADLVVEVMGGLDPARDYVLRAMAAGRHVVTANKMLLAHHGEELWAAAREHEVQLRFEAAVAGVVPVIRVLQESLAGAHVERLHGIVNGTTNFILSQMAETGRPYPEALAEAQRLGYAEADPTQDVNGEDAAAKMAILARLAFDTPVRLDQVVFEGIEQHHPGGPGLREGVRARASSSSARPSAWPLPGATGRRRRRPRPQRARASRVPLRGPPARVGVRPVQRRDDRVAGHHGGDAQRPGAGGPQTASAILGDVISAMIPPASTPETTQSLPLVRDVESAFYLHLEVADRPGVLAQVAQLLGLQGASVKSVVQKGLGGNARLVMVVHPLLESRFFAAVELIGGLDFLRSRPAAIRVIEEEYA
jgi:homoserine dehydrogenase